MLEEQKKYIELFTGFRSICKLKLDDINLYCDEKSYGDLFSVDRYKGIEEGRVDIGEK